MKVIDHDYEIYVGIGPVRRQAYYGGVWTTVEAWDIGRAPSATWQPAPPEDRRIMGMVYARRPGQRGKLAVRVRSWLRGQPGGASASQIAMGLEGTTKLREQIQNVLRLNADWFMRAGYGRWVCKA